MEEGVGAGNTGSRYRFFKYFLCINFLIFLAFCCFSVWCLYQLNKAMRTKESSAVRLHYVSRNYSTTTTTTRTPDESLNNIMSMINDAMKGLGVEQKGLVVTNLTDFEIHILKEYAKMKRTKRSVGCTDLNLTIDNGDRDRIRVAVKPVQYGRGKVNVQSVISYPKKNGTSIRECALDVSYEPKGQT